MNSKVSLALGAIVLAPIIGGLIRGLDRVITARMQSRVGPPLSFVPVAQVPRPVPPSRHPKTPRQLSS